MSDKTERILHAAILGEDCKSFFMGKSHADCFHQASNIKASISKKAKDQGFITSEGNFVSREEAAKIATAAGQVSNINFLFSEDLWSTGPYHYDYVKGYYI